MADRVVGFGLVGGGLMGREFASAAARWVHLAQLGARPRLVHVCDPSTEARAWYERTRAACGPPQLFSEEYDAHQHQMRGNLPQAFVHALGVDKGRGQTRERIAQDGIERRADEGIDPALGVQQHHRRIAKEIQEGRAGVSGRSGATGV
jgi:hypothetical protein